MAAGCMLVCVAGEGERGQMWAVLLSLPHDSEHSPSSVPRAHHPAAQMLQMLLKLPAFVFVVWCMFWSLPLSNVFGFMQAWRFWGGRNDMYEW